MKYDSGIHESCFQHCSPIKNNFRLEKKNLQSNDVLIHIDFNENYLCKYAQEIQSVHFGGSHQQITLHTGVAYVKAHESPIKVIPFCTLSESLKHDAPAIGAHIKRILNHIKEHEIKTIEYIS